MDSRDIILFDLNGTLCYRPKDNPERPIFVRPHIRALIQLTRYYRIGVYSSVMRKNAFKIIDAIEQICETEVFDRSLIFTQEHTISFTKAEYKKYDIPYYKRKKTITPLFSKETIKRVHIIDDQIFRICEKEHAISIPSWTGSDTDCALLSIVFRYIVKQKKSKENL